MAYKNIPAYDKKKLSFGPAIVYIGPEGATPSVDIGTVREVQFTVTRKTLDVMQGSPEVLIESWATQEDAVAKFKGLEWNFTNIAYAIGAGQTTAVGMTESLAFGGDMSISERAVRMLHVMPSGATLDVQLFRTKGSGAIDVKFDESAAHSIDYEFRALAANTNFLGAAPADKESLFRILKINP